MSEAIAVQEVDMLGLCEQAEQAAYWAQHKPLMEITAKLTAQAVVEAEEYNGLVDRLNTAELKWHTTRDQLDAVSRDLERTSIRANQLDGELADAHDENDQLRRQLAAMADQVAGAVGAVQAERDKHKGALSQLQNELKQLRALNPKALKEQNKRLKARIEQQETAAKLAKEYRAETLEARRNVVKLEQDLVYEKAKNKVGLLRCIYSDGECSLLIYPTPVKFRDVNQDKVYDQWNLLWMHHSGIAGLLGYTDQGDVDGKFDVSMSDHIYNAIKASNNELAIPDDVYGAAKAWLHQVNGVQHGNIKSANLVMTRSPDDKTK